LTARKKAIEKAKLIAKERDGYICQKCGATRDQAQIQGSHIIPSKAGGVIAADPENIIALCSSCHKWAGDSWHEDPKGQQWFDKKFPGLYDKLKAKHEVRPIKNYEWIEILEELKQRATPEI
jgi:5-methylcytosine-specific restriction endonuclease McrA